MYFQIGILSCKHLCSTSKLSKSCSTRPKHMQISWLSVHLDVMDPSVMLVDSHLLAIISYSLTLAGNCKNFVHPQCKDKEMHYCRIAYMKGFSLALDPYLSADRCSK